MEGCSGRGQSLKNLALSFVAKNINIYQQRLIEQLPEVSVSPFLVHQTIWLFS